MFDSVFLLILLVQILKFNLPSKCIFLHLEVNYWGSSSILSFQSVMSTTYFKNNMFENILNMNIDNLKVEE